MNAALIMLSLLAAGVFLFGSATNQPKIFVPACIAGLVLIVVIVVDLLYQYWVMEWQWQ